MRYGAVVLSLLFSLLCADDRTYSTNRTRCGGIPCFVLQRPRKDAEDDRTGDGLMPDQGMGVKVNDATSLLPNQGMSSAAPSSHGGALAYDAKGNPIGGPISNDAAAGGHYFPTPPVPGFGTNYAQVPPPGKASRTNKGGSSSAVLPPVFYPSQDPNQLGSSSGRIPKVSGHEKR